MRKVVAGLFVTLDGVTEAPERWQGPYMNQEVGQALAERMAASDTILLGRRTYQEWASFWPHQGRDNPFAAHINAAPKLVASTTLNRVDWANASLIEGNVAEALADLKQQPGKDISVNGSATLVRSLIASGTLDELSLLVHPIVVGGDRRLFDGVAPVELHLVEAKPFANGVVSLTYRPQ